MEKLRVGVVGVGSVVREIYQYLYFRSDFTPILDIVAVADPNDQFREWFCDTFNIPQKRRYRDYKEMFAQNELDAAQINTPDHIHAGPTIDSLEAGLDVVVPKPTAATVKDTHAMIQTARRTAASWASTSTSAKTPASRRPRRATRAAATASSR